MSYICMLIWCGVMMLITSVAISCCRVIAGSTSVCLRMLGVAEDSDSDERRRDSARLQPPQIYITVPPSSLPLFHLSVLLHRRAPDLNSSLSPVRLGKYIIQSARAPCLWLEPQTYTYAFTHEKKKVTHNQRMQIRVCVCASAHQLDIWVLFQGYVRVISGQSGAREGALRWEMFWGDLF